VISGTYIDLVGWYMCPAIKSRIL